MKEVGIVSSINVKKGNAVVQFERKTACDSCHMCAFRKRDMFVNCVVPNSLGAKVGNRVSVEMGGSFVLTSAFVVYIIPVVLMLVALLASQKLSGGYQVGLAMAGLVLGGLVTLFVDKKVKKKKGYAPQMTGIIPIEENPSDEEMIDGEEGEKNEKPADGEEKAKEE